MKQIKMNRTIKMSLITVAVLTFTACNNQQGENKTQKESKGETSVITDTTQNAIPKSGKIALDKLPANIKEYVNQNFQGYSIKSAEYDPLCTGGDAIDVVISKKGSPNYSLIFLLDGTFVQIEEDIDLSKAPSKVLEVVKTKYAGYKPASQIERLTLADKSIQYLLDITRDTITKEVIFKEDGTVICEH
mgnify:CR=1 FL=1